MRFWNVPGATLPLCALTSAQDKTQHMRDRPHHNADQDKSASQGDSVLGRAGLARNVHVLASKASLAFRQALHVRYRLRMTSDRPEARSSQRRPTALLLQLVMAMVLLILALCAILLVSSLIFWWLWSVAFGDEVVLRNMFERVFLR